MKIKILFAWYNEPVAGVESSSKGGFLLTVLAPLLVEVAPSKNSYKK